MPQLPCKTPEGGQSNDYPTGDAGAQGSDQFRVGDDTAGNDGLGCPIQAKLGWGISFFIRQRSKLPHPTKIG